MVHGFLIHSLGLGSSGDSGLSRMLYSRMFNSEPKDPVLGADEQDLEEERLLRKEQLAAVARQVKSSCILSWQAAGKTLHEFGLPPSDEPSVLQDAEFGVFRLPLGDPFSETKIVVWLGIWFLSFTLICDPHENLMLAENTLRTVTKYLLEYLKPLSQGSEILLKADKIEVILNRFLPHGQLLFINHRFVHSLEKELSSCILK
ncbi:AP-5 complex subunit sigma-1 [Latimeria chalumnae]|uniref:Adaptor related protein complex 5 subunit sigma 1 n=1 Tax=Latimeria chalumnae TaxID=7897 RepID=H3A7Z3_LATCH|nr:PREDICTED: AP-5 complex subunit sigma-1 [Latimeria chalumnae]|eukprot:XP_006005779.1 PREDICTED: AP-5 complex subunit sigma-1 [Latimeria chalumnae]